MCGSSTCPVFPCQVYGASLKDPASACLVMELVPGGNLHQRIYDRALPRMTHLDILQAGSASLCHWQSKGLRTCQGGRL